MAASSLTDGKKALFTFGRFQPPTIGHKVLIDFVVEAARLATAANDPIDPFIYVSSKLNDMGKYMKSKKFKEMQATGSFESTDLNENPLSVDVKLEYLKKMYPDHTSIFMKGTTLFKIIDELRSNGYTSITMAVGSDRVATFQKILGKSGIDVISAGERSMGNAAVGAANAAAGGIATPNAKAMSGTKMREAAVKGDVANFTIGVMIGSMTEDDAIHLLNLVRVGLGYPELGAPPKGGERKTKTRRIRIKTTKKSRKYKPRLEERT